MSLVILPADNAVALGDAVRARRRAQSLRIDDAAALCGVSVDMLSRLENGKGSVQVDKLMTVLDGLGLALLLVAKDDPVLATLAHTVCESAEPK